MEACAVQGRSMKNEGQVSVLPLIHYYSNKITSKRSATLRLHDQVLVGGEVKPSGQWPLAKVVELHPSDDGSYPPCTSNWRPLVVHCYAWWLSSPVWKELKESSKLLTGEYCYHLFLGLDCDLVLKDVVTFGRNIIWGRWWRWEDRKVVVKRQQTGLLTMGSIIPTLTCKGDWLWSTKQ